MTVGTATVALNIICEGLLLMVLSIMMKIKVVRSKNKHTKLQTRVQKSYFTMFMTKTAENHDTLWSRT